MLLKILVLGAGGIGGYFGGRLARSGADVTFLVRARRAAQLATDGLRVRSPFGDFAMPVKAVTAAGDAGPVDVVLLSCKAYDLADAIEGITPAMGESTCVLPLLNGLVHMDRLDERFGGARVLGGLAYISAALAADGTVLHLNRDHKIVFGARAPSQEAVAAAFEAALAASGVGPERTDRVLQAMWDKFAIITTLAAVTSVLRAPVGEVLETLDGEAIMRDGYGECLAVAAAFGHPCGEAAQANARRLILQRGSPMKASMLRDIESGGRTEGEHIIGDMVHRARSLEMTIPVLRIAYAHVQAYERARLARA